MSIETGNVWIELDEGSERCVLIEYRAKRQSVDPAIFGLACVQCHTETTERQHLHLFREFETYRDDPHVPSWNVCSEGCAIALIQERGYTVIAKPGVVTA